MTYLSLALKIVLCLSVFTTAFLSVFKQTIDDNKRLTRQGRVSVACVCITFLIGVGNELLALRKEASSQAEKRASADQALVVQVKLDQALDDGRKRGEEAKAYMLEAEVARRKLEAVQQKLDDISTRVSDPTTQKLIKDVRRLTGNDITMTGEKIAAVTTLLQDVHNDLGEVRGLARDGYDAAKGARTEAAQLKSSVESMRLDLGQLKALLPPPKPDAGPDADASWPDGQFFSDDLAAD